MPNPTRREREEALIEKVWAQAQASALHPGDLREVLDLLRGAHRRENFVRKMCSHRIEGHERLWLDRTSVLSILDADDAPQGGA